MDTLSALEKIIVEFYDPFISNQRRQEIENNLLAFKNHASSWKDCIQYIRNGGNVLVSSFCLQVLDNVISKYWSKLSLDDKVILQNSVSNYLFHPENNIPLTTSKYLMKLIAKIARNEWSVVGGNFVSDIISIILSSDPKMVSLGLYSLLIASEELINPQDELCTIHKQEIRQNFEMHIPQIFSVLQGTFLKYKHSDVEESIYEVLLHVYSQLFSWLPLSEFYTIESLLPIYECAVRDDSNISVLALSALNEILYKNCVPSKNVTLIVSICCRLNDILSCISESSVQVVNDEYMVKITEMVSLIFSLHWHRIESNMEAAGIMSFLSSFYKLTFHRTDKQSYFTCLEIWHNFLEYLVMRDKLHVKQYESVLTSLLIEVIKKLENETLVNNINQLCEEEVEDPAAFFNQHMNVIDQIIALIPDISFALMFDIWNRNKQVYIQSWHAVGVVKNVPMLTNEQEIIASIHAFRVSTQILTALHSKATSQLKTIVAKELEDLVGLGNREGNRRYSYVGGAYDELFHHLLNVHCVLLKMMPVWIYVPLLSTSSDCDRGGSDGSQQETKNILKDSDSESASDGTIRELFSTTLPFLMHSENSSCLPELQVAAAHLIASLTSCTKRAALLQPLFVDPTFKHLPWEARISLQCALCRWVCSCESESFEDRLKFLHNLLELIVSNNFENLKNVCIILQNCNVTRSAGKRMLFLALEPWLEQVIAKYPIHFLEKSPLCDLSVSFLFDAFKILQNHFKSKLLGKMLHAFEMCLNDNANADSGYNAKSPVLSHDYGFEKMVAFFILLMESPGFTNSEYIPDVVCVAQKIYQRIKINRTTSSSGGTGVDGFSLEFHKLLCCILLNKWRYFYKLPRPATVAVTEELNRKEIFETILGLILESFSESDISIYRNNLQAVEEINTKWNLYEKELFRVKYLPVVLNTLLTALVEGYHKLLTDEILSAVYHMAAVDFKTFYNINLQSFLKSVPGLTEQQVSILRNSLSPQTDMPSFFQNISQLINDVRSYRIESGFS